MRGSGTATRQPVGSGGQTWGFTQIRHVTPILDKNFVCPIFLSPGLIRERVFMPPQDLAEHFVFLLARHERQLGAYVMTMVPHPQDADDILQEAKVVMWRNFEKFELGTNFGAWARKVAFHQVLAYRKRKHRDRLDFSEDFLRVVADEVESSTDHLEQR